MSTEAWRKKNRKKLRAYRMTWYYKNKDRQVARQKIRRQGLLAFVKQQKAGRSCPCGESDPVALDFHHRDPKQKSFALSASRSVTSKQQILNEIAKCDVLCANCHRKHHYRA